MPRLATVLAAAAAALSAAPIFAASTASATLGPVQITLYDLNPGDDIAASITFSNGEYYYDGSYVSTYAYDNYSGQYPSDGQFGLGPFGPITSTTSIATASATASVSGDGSASGTTLSASGTALGTAAPDNLNAAFAAQFGASANAPYYYDSFTVSSGTVVVISLPLLLTVAVDNSYDPSVTYGYEYASAASSISLSGTGASGTGSQYASDSRSIGIASLYVPDPNAPFGYAYTGDSASESTTMGVSFVNVSGGDLTGQLYMNANVFGYSYATAVPEPGTVALFLAGLAAVGGVARRRKA